MSVELTVVLYFQAPEDVPTKDDIEHAFEADVIVYEEEEV